MYRLLLESGTDFLRPGFQLREGAHRQQPVIIVMAALAPDLAVKDQVGVFHRIDQDAAPGAVHGLLRFTSAATGLPQEDPAVQEDLNRRTEEISLAPAAA